MKTEIWNGHKIRFVEKDGEWWAVAVDVCSALGLKQVTRAISGLKNGVTNSKVIDSLNREQSVNIINEKSIYRLVFKSRKPEAEDFQDWVYSMLKELRKQSGLEGFQIFRMLDKAHQCETMKRLSAEIRSTRPPVRVDFIKANTIANKAISNRHGYEKMIKKADMSPVMLAERQRILEDTVSLMSLNERYCIGLSVSEQIYKDATN